MNQSPDLRTALLELVRALDGTDIRPIIGGGFGIFLKTECIRKPGVRTLFPEWPGPRSTNDPDIFLRPELLIHPEKLEPLARALKGLGYTVVPGAENYQFKKPGPDGSAAGSVKIDILTGPRDRFKGTKYCRSYV